MCTQPDSIYCSEYELRAAIANTLSSSCTQLWSSERLFEVSLEATLTWSKGYLAILHLQKNAEEYHSQHSLSVLENKQSMGKY